MEVFLNSRENDIYDFTCILLSVTVKDVKSIVQNIETMNVPVNVTALSY